MQQLREFHASIDETETECRLQKLRLQDADKTIHRGSDGREGRMRILWRDKTARWLTFEFDARI